MHHRVRSALPPPPPAARPSGPGSTSRPAAARGGRRARRSTASPGTRAAPAPAAGAAPRPGGASAARRPGAEPRRPPAHSAPPRVSSRKAATASASPVCVPVPPRRGARRDEPLHQRQRQRALVLAVVQAHELRIVLAEHLGAKAGELRQLRRCAASRGSGTCRQPLRRSGSGSAKAMRKASSSAKVRS